MLNGVLFNRRCRKSARGGVLDAAKQENTRKTVSESFHLYEKKLGLNLIDSIHFLL